MNTTVPEQLFHLLAESPASSYDEISKRLQNAQLLFQEYVCQQIQEPLNLKLKEMPHHSYEEKRYMSVWLNSELRSFGIAVKCPNTGLACSFHADAGRTPNNAGKFRLIPVDDEKRRTLSSVQLFPISLMPRPVTKSRFDNWSERMSRTEHQERDIP
jgi:hypothetical protein